MLVDVIKLRRDGRKLTQEELQRATPIRGYLVFRAVKKPPDARPDLPAESAWAVLQARPDDVIDALAGLQPARVTVIKDGALVITGEETYGPPASHPPKHLQAWYCTVVATQSTSP